MNWIVGFLAALGVFLILTASLPGLYPPARRTLRLHAPRQLTRSQVLQDRLAGWIAPHLDFDPIKRSRTELLLRNLGHTEPPELFHARAMAEGAFIALLCAPALLFSLPLGLIIMLFGGVMYYNRRLGALEKELEEKRTAIERELPQFASTICQSLGTTRDIVAILTSYRRVCGPALAGEIDKTLNDVMTGNAERAVRALENRVASARLSQVTRGLLAVLRGDEQRQYFDILAEEFRRSQDEAVERELLRRPQKLHPYLGVLFVFFALMIAASLGTDLMESMKLLS